jgi:hypothetical protein
MFNNLLKYIFLRNKEKRKEKRNIRIMHGALFGSSTISPKKINKNE